MVLVMVMQYAHHLMNRYRCHVLNNVILIMFTCVVGQNIVLCNKMAISDDGGDASIASS